MNDTIKTLIERRSCKLFDSSKVVKKDLLDQILEAGTYAPSGRNLQSSKIIVIRDKSTIKEIAKINASILGVNYEQVDPFYGATTLVIVFADKRVNTYIEDGSLVMGNLLNAAFSLGVDSCWIHRAKEEFESPLGLELKKKWGLDDNYVGIGNCILGYRKNNLMPSKPRKKDYINFVD